MTGSVVSGLALNNTVGNFDARRLSRIQLTRIQDVPRNFILTTSSNFQHLPPKARPFRR